MEAGSDGVSDHISAGVSLLEPDRGGSLRGSPPDHLLLIRLLCIRPILAYAAGRFGLDI